MFRQFKLRTRLLGGFSTLLLMCGVLLAVAGFGLFVAQKGVDGIVNKLIPVSNITVVGRTALIDSREQTARMVASIFDKAEITKARADWDASQQRLDKAMDDFERLIDQQAQRDNLKTFRAHIATYRQAVQPVAAKLAEDGYSEAKEAMQAMRAASESADALLGMLGNIEANLAKGSKSVFDKVQGTVSFALAALAAGFIVFAVLGIALAWLLSRSIIGPLGEARALADAIAAGDLRQSPQVLGKDEAADMMRSLAAMRASLAGIVGNVRSSADSIQVASTEVATGNLDLSSRTEQTASNLQQTAASMEELTGTLRQSADSAGSANQLASSAAQIATRGGEVVEKVVSTMDEISQSSKKIADIIGVIDGIAFQTNILALNAAVEAARAGEQGRGFAVVAGEVRSLAQRSSEAAKEIRGLIGSSVDRVEAGTQLVRDAGTTMNDIVASVKRVTDIIGEITTAATQQSVGIEQVNAAVSQLDQMTQQNAALVEQSAAAASSLKEQATRLAGVVSTFQLADTAQA
jgi:methyl-accepting chemotaxis protein